MWLKSCRWQQLASVGGRCNAFGLDYGALGLLSSLSKFARMIFGPLWAMAADRFGRKKVPFLVDARGFTVVEGTYVMAVFSIGFSGCVLPMVSTVVPKQLSATAFAMLFSVIQGGLTAVPSLLMGQLANVLGLSQTFLYVVVLPYLVNAAFWFLFYRVYPRDVELQEQRSRQVEAAAR